MKIISAVVLIMLASSASAQTCTYDTCALRVEGREVKRGLDGARVGRLGLFRAPQLARLPEVPQEARIQFEIFENNFPQAQVLGLASGILVAVAYSEGLRGELGSRDEWTLGLSIAGVVSGIVAAVKTKQAMNGLSRGIWFYNRQFVK